MSGFDNDIVYAKNGDFTQADNQTVSESNGLVTDGKLWIGSTALNVGGTHINVGGITSPNGTITVGYNSPSITLDLAGGGEAIDSIAVQTGTSPIVPTVAGLVTINGAVVASGTNPIRSDGTGVNTMALEVQISQALAATDATKIGLSNFDSAAFDVDANGFVQLNGGGIAATAFDVDAHTAPGTDPVVPTVAGVIVVTGSRVVAGTSPVKTNSLAANTYTVEVQTSQAIASTDATKTGICNFSSSDFSVDENGFVTLSTGGAGKTITGNTGGAISPVDNNWNLITDGTNVVVAGTAGTLTMNYAKDNLLLGSKGTHITAAINSVGLGNLALDSLTSGEGNTGIGTQSLTAVSSGSHNTALGALSLISNNNSGNTAIGWSALNQCVQSGNTAIGYSSLSAIFTGSKNVAVGFNSLVAIDADSCTGVGYDVFSSLIGGAGFNTGLGDSVGSNLTTGGYNTIIGQNSGLAYTSGESSNILISSNGIISESNTTRIGTQGAGDGQQNRTFIAGIVGVTTANSELVTIDSTTGQLGVATVPDVFTWNDVSGAFSALNSNGYFVTGTATGTLPATPSQGDTIKFLVDHASQLLTIQASGTQIIRLGTLTSSAGGTMTSTLQGDSLELVYRAADTTWQSVVGSIGTWVAA